MGPKDHATVSAARHDSNVPFERRLLHDWIGESVGMAKAAVWAGSVLQAIEARLHTFGAQRRPLRVARRSVGRERRPFHLGELREYDHGHQRDGRASQHGRRVSAEDDDHTPKQRTQRDRELVGRGEERDS